MKFARLRRTEAGHKLVCGGPAVVAGLGCGKESKTIRQTLCSAKPDAHAAALLEKDGWTSDAGTVTAMFMGLSVLCPACSRKARGSDDGL